MRGRCALVLLASVILCSAPACAIPGADDPVAEEQVRLLLRDGGLSQVPPGAEVRDRDSWSRCNRSSGDEIPPGVAILYEVEDAPGALQFMRASLRESGWRRTAASTTAVDHYTKQLAGEVVNAVVDTQSGDLVVSAGLADRDRYCP